MFPLLFYDNYLSGSGRFDWIPIRIRQKGSDPDTQHWLCVILSTFGAGAESCGWLRVMWMALGHVAGSGSGSRSVVEPYPVEAGAGRSRFFSGACFVKMNQIRLRTTNLSSDIVTICVKFGLYGRNNMTQSQPHNLEPATWPRASHMTQSRPHDPEPAT